MTANTLRTGLANIQKPSGESSIAFPDLSLPGSEILPEGIVAVGGLLNVPTLHLAYSRGIFPWPQEGYPMLWFCPEKRGLLSFAELHIPHSLQKWARQNSHLEIRLNQDFDKIIEACSAQPRPGQEGTWILPAMKEAYQKFFAAGYVVCVGVYEENQLVGGIYGVLVEGVFSAESMFYKKSNASKLALWHLIRNLQEHGFEWMDIQMVTPITEAFGGRYISRAAFLQLLKEVHSHYGVTPKYTQTQ